jgi:excinuclease ABC subunit C
MPAIKDYKKIPAEPGCYLFKDEAGTVLYVGKAKSLRKRVASYFTKKHEDPKTELLVKHIREIDYFVTKNEVEALILENNLIKKHYPRYNIDLKDSRRYAYLHVSEDELPIISVARTRELPGKYYGPFTSGKSRREILKLLERQFKILTSKPSALKKKSLDRAEYLKRLKVAEQILKGKTSELVKSLRKEMDAASKEQNYEYALILRRQIDALLSLKEKQNMELRRNYDSDVVNYIRKGDVIYLLVFNVYKGVLENKQEFEFPYRETFLEEFLLQFYAKQKVPKELILPDEIDSSLALYLEKQRGKRLMVVVPQKGEKKALLDLVLKNVSLSLHGEKIRVLALQEVLKLDKAPNLIECFDISHLRGTNTVASMVVFKDGKPLKSSYRKFRMRLAGGGDDYAAMHETLYRRYGKSLRETMPMPDLIVVDGGLGQLHAAEKVLRELKLEIQVISLAKRLEEIYVPGQREPVRLGLAHQGLLLLRALRDEAHRFAISYQRSLRKKAVKGK